jgi:RNA polymerase sigma-70 factor (ECF subfamily)
MQIDYALADVATRRLANDAGERSDDCLISAIARGDKHSLKVLYARHNVRVYRFALRLTRDESLAEDVVSEVFLHAWRGAKNFQAKSKVSTWLLAIAHNKAKDALQRRRYEYLSDDDAAAIEDPADNPEAVWSKKERGALLQECLTKLPAAQREVVDLVYYHHKSVEEVAQIVGVQASTVKTRMFYARSRLAQMLIEAGVEHAWAA